MKVMIDGHMIRESVTGIGRYHYNLIRALHDNHNNIKLSTYLDSTDTIFDFEIPKYFARFKNGLYRTTMGLNLAMRRLKPDIIHVSFFSPFIKYMPVVASVYDISFKIYPGTFQYKNLLKFKLFFERSLKLSDAIICISRVVERDLIKFYSIDPSKIFVIYGAPDRTFKFSSNKKQIKNYLQEKFGINGDYFLVVGDISKRKNPITIIEAFSQLSKRNKEITLVFSGPNKMGSLVSTRYKSLLEKNHLKLLGYVRDEDLNLLYNGASALVYSSLYEGFGLPIVEAMACKTPVICNDIQVFHEVASNAAIFAKNGSELYRAMEQILKDKSFREKYAELGYQRSKFFSWKKTARQTLEVYNWVLDKNKKMGQLDKKT